GDVMTGRGIDQVLPHSNEPALHEPYVRNANQYVNLAEQAHGEIPDSVSYKYIWGDALEHFRELQPDFRLINLETAVTDADTYQKNKGIHYRMHPENIRLLTEAEITVAGLANNHVLDWGEPGLLETFSTLNDAGIAYAGAGKSLEEAKKPYIRRLENNTKIFLFAAGTQTSGIPLGWQAGENTPGVWMIEKLSRRHIDKTVRHIQATTDPGDIIIFSIHWGGNWGYETPDSQRRFAHALIDEAGVDVIHGHSSHHVKGIEVYQKKLILYGCGDFITDYEGIRGKEQYRDDLGFMYFPDLDPETGNLVNLTLAPTKIRRFQITGPTESEIHWLEKVLNREGKKLGTSVTRSNGKLKLQW
ncbi:MAG: poly-gamma-glutamate biosynthesis protein, partial [Candidatus Marinimicrobia bacterium]|nr:poly-gamma-glutamate biosynthesis protein [Candidatus Neomarinimicrobiota bacterium]